MHQLVDATGSVGLAQTFDPYGNGYTRAGSAASSLGFTGEQTDSNGFVFLRARYYQPGMGRFTQMDPSRQESNLYQYAKSRPTMYVDPSGYCSTDDIVCMQLRQQIMEQFGVAIDIPDDPCNSTGIPNEPISWSSSELSFIIQMLEPLQGFWGKSGFSKLFIPVTFRKTAENEDIYTDNVDDLGRVSAPVINLTRKTTFDANIDWTFRIVWHDLYHDADYHLSGNQGTNFETPSWLMNMCLKNPSTNPSAVHSVNFALSVGWNSMNCEYSMIDMLKGPHNPLDPDPQDYSTRNPLEDFAVTYSTLTQVILGGQELCTTSFLRNECITSPYHSNGLVQPVPNITMDDYRLKYFRQDALIYGTNVATHDKWFWE